MEEIEIYDANMGSHRRVVVDGIVAEYIEMLEQTNRILSFQKDSVSTVYLEQQDDIDAVLDLMHHTHEN